MFEAALIVISVIAFLTFVIWQSRKQSIVGIPARNRHFRKVASDFGFTIIDDGYFLLLKGNWKDYPVMIYPHNFEGPGSITVFYADSGVPLLENSWVEPYMSLGRAVVGWKKGEFVTFGFTGNQALKNYSIVEALERHKMFYPYLAITQPERFIYSHVIQEALSGCKNFIVLVVLDTGRKPTRDELKQAMDAAADIASALNAAFLPSGENNNGARPE